ncbi:hypothetical protein Bbelb_440670 [Branchiostoma belcheri]|nr:hypothetical protein Bbelb_440670 [Branchiostoma belcheri]
MFGLVRVRPLRYPHGHKPTGMTPDLAPTPELSSLLLCIRSGSDYSERTYTNQDGTQAEEIAVHHITVHLTHSGVSLHEPDRFHIMRRPRPDPPRFSLTFYVFEFWRVARGRKRTRVLGQSEAATYFRVANGKLGFSDNLPPPACLSSRAATVSRGKKEVRAVEQDEGGQARYRQHT